MKMGPAKAGQDLKLEAFDITGLKVDVGQLGHGFGWFWKLLRCKDTMFQVSVIVRSCALAEWSLEANVGRWQFFRSSWWNQDGDEVDPRLASVVQDSLAGSASVEKAVHLEFCTGLFGCFYLLLCFVGFCFVKFCCWYLLYFVVCVLLFPMIPMFFCQCDIWYTGTWWDVPSWVAMQAGKMIETSACTLAHRTFGYALCYAFCDDRPWKSMEHGALLSCKHRLKHHFNKHFVANQDQNKWQAKNP